MKLIHGKKFSGICHYNPNGRTTKSFRMLNIRRMQKLKHIHSEIVLILGFQKTREQNRRYGPTWNYSESKRNGTGTIFTSIVRGITIDYEKKGKASFKCDFF